MDRPLFVSRSSRKHPTMPFNIPSRQSNVLSLRPFLPSTPIRKKSKYQVYNGRSGTPQQKPTKHKQKPTKHKRSCPNTNDAWSCAAVVRSVDSDATRQEEVGDAVASEDALLPSDVIDEVGAAVTSEDASLLPTDGIEEVGGAVASEDASLLPTSGIEDVGDDEIELVLLRSQCQALTQANLELTQANLDLETQLEDAWNVIDRTRRANEDLVREVLAYKRSGEFRKRICNGI